MRKIILFLIITILIASIVSAGRVVPALEKEMRGKNADDKISVLVQFHSKPSFDDINDARMKGKIKHQFKIIDGLALELPVRAVNAIAMRKNVRLVEPDYITKAFLDISVPLIKANSVWQYTTGAGVNVAVIDTGIAGRPELNVVKRVDFTGEGTGDLHGHGTHVAGIVASKDATYKGVAPGANLFEVKVLNSAGTGYGSNIIAGIDWAIGNGADILSMSLGAMVSPCDGTDSLSLAVDNAVNAGKIVIVAAGNSGPSYNTIASPGCSKKGITVGASDDYDQIAYFSSRGPTADGRTKPDVVAPGTGIISLSKTTGFVSMSGTSMATPHVAGMAALLKNKDSSLTQARLLDLLKSTSKNLSLDANTQGFGRVDALALYNLLSPAPAEVCGNGVCASGESCSTCSTDCGVCPEVCGNGKCAGGETCKTCPIDCGKCPRRKSRTGFAVIETPSDFDSLQSVFFALAAISTAGLITLAVMNKKN